MLSWVEGLAGDTFPTSKRFERIRRIGSGGFGVVYEAYDHEREGTVALKTVRFVEVERIFGLKREFRSLKGIRHPNLVRLFELFEEGGIWFFTMELVDGVELLEWVRPSASPWTLHRAPTMSASGPIGSAGSMTDDQLPDTIPVGSHMPGELHVGRLRSCLAQLARGLMRVHAARKIHRDVKPSNILTTAEGRVVVLDFGLVAEVDSRALNELIGTPHYMAPEQATIEEEVGPAADWYGAGVVLFEALTGTLPFSSNDVHEVLQAKVRGTAPSVLDLEPSAPADLAELCAGLLRRNPKERLNGTHILDVVASGSAIQTDSNRRNTVPPALFVGRPNELRQIEDRFHETVSARRAAVCLIRGESGVGKSELLRESARRLSESACVFFGRCHENEMVPYKALDGIVDALSDDFANRPSEYAAALVPRDAGLLCTTFPVLGRVAAFRQAVEVSVDGLSLNEVRNRAFEALRELVTRLAHRRPLVFIIDDLQWTDRDSLLLLERLLKPPEQPPVLLVASMRAAARPHRSVEEIISSLSAAGDLHTLELEPLEEEHAQQLALALAASSDGIDATAIAREAAGHPLYIETLVREASKGTDPRHIRLEDAIVAQISRLPPVSRLVLELLALSPQPLDRQTARVAADISRESLAEEIDVLSTERLIRRDGIQADGVEPYHDSVRRAVLAGAGDRAPSLHRRLALAIESSGRPDYQALCLHWQAAGDFVKGADYAEAAGDQANESLAFDRAAEHYRAAIHLRGRGSYDLWTKLAHALAYAGRGADSAQACLLAADSAGPGAKSEWSRRMAADQLMRSGYIDRGIATMTPFLADMGLSMPSTTRRAVLSFLTQRMRIHIAHPALGFRERSLDELSQQEIDRMDLCWSAAIGLFTVDQMRGLHFHAKHLALALRAGEPSRVARGLAMEAASLAAIGAKPTKSEILLERARAISESLDEAYLKGIVSLVTGVVSYLRGTWLDAATHLEVAERIFRDDCKGASWEIGCASMSRRWSLCYLGRLKELSYEVRKDVEAAYEQGDLYARVSASSGFPNIAWLLADDSGAARKETSAAIAGWSQTGFHLQHLFDMFAQVQIDLYEGRGSRAFERTEEAWPTLKSAGLLKVEMNRVLMHELRGRAALACAYHGASDRGRCLRAGRSSIAALKRVPRAWARGLGAMLEAQLVLVESADQERTTQLLSDALRVFDNAHMTLHRQAAAAFLDMLNGGPPVEDRDESRGLAWLENQGARRPTAIVAMIAPLFSATIQPS